MHCVDVVFLIKLHVKLDLGNAMGSMYANELHTTCANVPCPMMLDLDNVVCMLMNYKLSSMCANILLHPFHKIYR
jgi:hypothetical protein